VLATVLPRASITAVDRDGARAGTRRLLRKRRNAARPVLPLHTGTRVRRLFEDGSGALRAARRSLRVVARMSSAADRFYYEASYRALLPLITLTARCVPLRVLRRLADRADRREAEAHYTDEARRVGILRRMAVDRYDVRSDTAVTYYLELRRRSEGS
jgi:hypothetical protein